MFNQRPRSKDRGQIYKKIMTNEKPTFEQLCDPDYRRKELVTEKMGATWVAFTELDGLINLSKLAGYFKKSQSWLSQKINGCTVCKRKRAFTEEEYHQLAESFRDIAKRLMAHADEIDAAEMESDSEQ